jgi:hypothetical protein
LILANNRKLKDFSMHYIYAFNEEKIEFEVFFRNVNILNKLFPNKYKSILDNHLSESPKSKNKALSNAATNISHRICEAAVVSFSSACFRTEKLASKKLNSFRNGGASKFRRIFKNN